MSDPNSSDGVPSIESIVHEIEVRAKMADNHVIAAALKLRDLRQRVEAGDAGEGVKWMEWARENFRKLSKSRLYELNVISQADDMQEELERLRRLTREKVKEHRERKAALEQAMEPERKKLREWVKVVPIHDVRIILREIENRQHVRELRALSLSNDDVDKAA